MAYIQRRAAQHAAVLITRTIATCIGFLGASAFVALIILNALGGCGERFYTVYGTYEQGACITLGDLFSARQVWED